ncbi:MAG: 3',5'-cyclic-AMP phosphodiesterase [Methylococcaceae bacterium]|nr:3',5'-cyclic-AMP phosphodiesterase [Methylococcaceae bacterium]MDP3903484.1 3',5'-cyclic-AMP phosphodiesterase [Methylococcaceae bacterium]
MNTSDENVLSILQLSDMHILSQPGATLLGVDTLHYFHACLKQALSSGQRFDLLLLTGDLAQEPCIASYQQILKCLEHYPALPCLCLPGNHDDYDLMQQVFKTDKVSCDKQLLLNNWQVINLNSQIPGKPGGRLAEQELLFLEQCLEDYPALNAIIAVHHHCIKSKSKWMDTMMVENSEELLAIVRRFPQIKALINGHIHQELEAEIGATQVFGTPSTCFQFSPGSTQFSVDDTPPGYRLIHLGNNGNVNSEVIRLPGRLTELKLTDHGY